MIKNKKIKSIKTWAEDDRPREKLLLKGCMALSDAELLAILINSGNRNESAVQLSKRILATSNHNLNQLGKLSFTDLKKFNGIGEAKAIAIITALELGKRRQLSNALQQDKITSSNHVFNIMQPVIGDLVYEEFWVIFLNNSNRVIQKIQLSKGGLTGTLVDVRLLFKKALEILATGIIICHNHPSGKLKPSQSDKLITTKMQAAGKTLDIKVLDHIIITENDYFSFADEGLI